MAQDITPRVIWIADDRLPAEHLSGLTRILNYLKTKIPLAIVKASQFNEDSLLFRLKTTHLDIVVAPIKEYMKWERIEHVFGSNRTKGPVFAGYFCETTENKILEHHGSAHRRILFDCKHLLPSEINLILQNMLNENKRSGIKPFLQADTLIYCENWYPKQGLGVRLDNILNLPMVQKGAWHNRVSALRLLLSALWGVIYEEGPGRMHEGHASDATSPIAYFQLAADAQCLAMRLLFQPGSHASAAETLKHYTPGHLHPTRGRQLLLHYSDFLRVHAIPETGTLEITTLLFPSAPIEKDADHLHSVWIDPLAESLLVEPPYVGPNPLEPRLRALPTVEVDMPRLKALESLSNLRTEKATKRLLTEAGNQIRDLKIQVKEQSEKLHELRSGGVGISQPPAPPEPEDLLNAFQERYFDARYQIRQFELQIAKLEKEGGKAYDLEVLRMKMEALENREKAWIRKLMTTLEDYRKVMKKDPKSKGE
ncbi:MAG: hypothetical protein HYX41_03000 [Bdellovibrio sp.]|nr:hypothetical protein [Bdellovibrio sp.]